MFVTSFPTVRLVIGFYPKPATIRLDLVTTLGRAGLGSEVR